MIPNIEQTMSYVVDVAEQDPRVAATLEGVTESERLLWRSSLELGATLAWLHLTRAPKPVEAPPFDPDPELVADVENNPFALRAFRKAATEAHEKANRMREARP